MATDPFLMMERLEHDLGEEIRAATQHIVAGRYKSFDEYKEAVGHLRGMERAQVLLKELVDAVKDQ